MGATIGRLIIRCISFTMSMALAATCFAADVETVGDLKVGGVIESTSGGFKFPDGTTWTTGSMDGLHFNVGFVVDDSNSNAGNLTSGAIKFGTGATGEGIASQRTAGDNNNGLDFYTNSTARLSITNSGNVGIGTRTPAARLQVLSSEIVQAQFGAHPIYLQNADGGATSLLGFNLYWGAASKYVYGSSHTGATINNYGGGLAFGVAAAGTAGGSPAGDYPTWVMRMTSEGRVRIGDLGTPSETLDVAGNIKASGNITAGAGATHTPLAYGKFGSTGSKTAGSSNITCVWNATRYECTISGESYYFQNYVVNVTPDGSLAIPRTGSVDNKLLIYFYNLANSTIQPSTGFSVTVYKP
jgi:hypothetical protein